MADTTPSWLAVVNTPFVRFMRFLLPLLWIDCIQFFLCWTYVDSTAIILVSWALGTMTLGVLVFHQRSDALYASEYRRAAFFHDQSFSADTNIQHYRTYIVFIKDFPYKLILLTECVVAFYVFLFVVTGASVQRWPDKLPVCFLVSVIIHFVCPSSVTIVWAFFMIKRNRFYRDYSPYFPGAVAIERAYVQSLLSITDNDTGSNNVYSIGSSVEIADDSDGQTNQTRMQEREQTRVSTDDTDSSTIPLIDATESNSSSSSSIALVSRFGYDETKET